MLRPAADLSNSKWAVAHACAGGELMQVAAVLSRTAASHMPGTAC